MSSRLGAGFHSRFWLGLSGRALERRLPGVGGRGGGRGGQVSHADAWEVLAEQAIGIRVGAALPGVRGACGGEAAGQGR